MLFTTVATTFLSLTLVSAAPLDRRTASKIVNDLELVSSDVATLQSTVDSFADTVTSEIEFESAMDNLNLALKSIITDTSANAPFITTDSTRLDGKMDLFSPTMVTAIKTLGAMAADFEAAGFTSTALADIELIQTDLDTYYNDLEILMDATDLPDIAALKTTLDKAFKNTIADFS